MDEETDHAVYPLVSTIGVRMYVYCICTWDSFTWTHKHMCAPSAGLGHFFCRNMNVHACTHSYDQVQRVCYVHSYRHIHESQEHSRFYAMKQPKSVNVEVISVMLTAYTDPRRSREITVTKQPRNNGYVCKVEGFRLHRQSNLVTFPCMAICVHAFSCLSCWSSPSSLPFVFTELHVCLPNRNQVYVDRRKP